VKQLKSFRLDQEILNKAKALSLPLAKIIEDALLKVINEKKCPCCGAKIKAK
jgi:hypothetical protein